MTINHLEPAGLWRFFEEICRIPRLSGNEGRIIGFLEDFARENGLESNRDKTGNLLIKKAASPGLEKIKPVVLQSHLDMVGEKDSNTVHDWDNDPIVPVIEGDWVRAEKTTLGADDGIGIAAQMKLLSDNEIAMGPIECLFTVDEESGMTGAKYLDSNFFTSSILINLDSEDEGQLFIGCAGGIDTIATLKYSEEKAPAGYTAWEITLSGLLGGHSGDEIHRGFGNSVKIMNRLLLELDSIFGINLCVFNGGNLRNAIPREAFATILSKPVDKEKLVRYVAEYCDRLREELGETDPGLKIDITEVYSPGIIIDRISQEKINMAIEKCPHGLIAWSKEMKDLVETSTNLASIKFTEGSSIKIVTSQRSSVESSKAELALRIEAIFRGVGADVYHSDGYPGWQPDTSSEILAVTKESYIKMFGEEPEVKAIHAGLECGLILKKFPGLDMISFGPTIKGAHTPLERININSTVKFWKLLLEVLRNIPAED